MDQGLSSAEACKIAGTNYRTGKRWRNGRAVSGKHRARPPVRASIPVPDPTAGSELMLTSAAEFGPAAPDYDFFDRWASGGVFAAFAALIIVAAWTLFKTRDA